MKSIASNDHAAIDALFDSVLHKRHRWPVAFDVVKCNIACIVDNLEAPLLARFHEIARYLGLAVDGDVLASQFLHVDADQPLAIGKVEAIVGKAFGFHAGIKPKTFHQADSDFFENACADTTEHVTGRLPFEHEALDPLGAQKMAQKQAGGTCADDTDRYYQPCTTFCRMAPNGEPPSSPRPSMRMVSPKAMNGVLAGPLSRIISIARISEMQLEPTLA